MKTFRHNSYQSRGICEIFLAENFFEIFAKTARKLKTRQKDQGFVILLTNFKVFTIQKLQIYSVNFRKALKF